MNALTHLVEEALAEVPVLDIHTHLVGGKLGARGLHDILLYHMVISDLYAAGCPNGARLTQFPAAKGAESEAIAVFLRDEFLKNDSDFEKRNTL